MALQQKASRKGETASLPRRMTYEEFLYCDLDRGEWVDGLAVQHPTPSYQHQGIADFLTALLGHFVEQNQLGNVVSAPFQMKPSHSHPGREPDVLFISNDRLGQVRENHLDGPADLAVEIISAESRRRDSVDKFREYQSGGVSEYWLIDPKRRQASFFHLDQKGLYQPIAVGEDGVFRSCVLPGFWVRVDWLWAESRPFVLSVLREWGLI